MSKNNSQCSIEREKGKVKAASRRLTLNCHFHRFSSLFRVVVVVVVVVNIKVLMIEILEAGADLPT